MISVIIPFLNEGENIRKTLHSLFDSCDLTDIEVILLNDLSTDNYDYDSLSHEFCVRYYQNSSRLGVSGSRERGVKLASNNIILFLDGHMKFLQPDWASKLVNHVINHPQHLFCSVSVAIDDNWNINPESPIGAGCTIDLSTESSRLLDTVWLPFVADNPAIPCIMGAAYAFDKNFYLHLRGLHGLAQWGYDEQFLSIKAYLAGGQCTLMSDIIVGHLYRPVQPYIKPMMHIEYNKIVCLYVLDLVPFTDIKRTFYTNPLFEQNWQAIENLRLQIKSELNQRSIQEFIEFNNKYMVEILERSCH
ncbi:glycosyltransferase [Rheinheimera riviphila]|uniref:Glycosyltransferase n=1 Tax=Rheinheimera riviphila TaxID=1834037 RepID=A0A437R0L8_9GAMM|nr:glycosyltransferase [Rheinheimera riviphila]RVU40263.1 glycosyltransferase [Rheinheimera riviphila]